MPIIYKDPTPKQTAALRAWRREPSRERMWRRYRRAAEALEHSEVPAFDGEKTDKYEHIKVHGWVDSRVLLVCEKMSTINALESWEARKRPSFSYTHRALTSWVPWLPSRRAVDQVLVHATRPRLPVAWFGDLDPQAIHWFATLRAGGRQELLRSQRARHRIASLGLDSTWLDWLERKAKSLLPFTIAMRHADCEYWEIVQRLVPDTRELIGRRASEFLDSGKKIEVDGIIHQHREAFLHELGRRLRAATRG